MNVLTTVQMSENEDARLIVDAACWRDEGLGSVLKKRRTFDLMLIMAGTSHLAMGVASLHGASQDLSFGGISDVLK